MADVTDPNGVVCDESSLDGLGYCLGDAIPTSYGDYCAPRAGYDLPSYSGPNACYTDANNNICQDQYQDAFGYCFGDATTDCAGNLYSPSFEDWGRLGSTNGCNYLSQDDCGVCCGGNGGIDCNGVCFGGAVRDGLDVCNGNCWDSSACGEDSNGCLYDNGCGCLDRQILVSDCCDSEGSFAYPFNCGSDCSCGRYGGCDDFSNCGGSCYYSNGACGEDSNGCLYQACNGECTSITPTLYPNCPQPSVQPSVLVSYKVGALPIPQNPNNPALRNVLLAQNTNFPLIIQVR